MKYLVDGLAIVGAISLTASALLGIAVLIAFGDNDEWREEDKRQNAPGLFKTIR